MTAAKRRFSARTRWALAAVLVLVVIATSVTGVFWALIALIGFVGVILGLAALVRKRSRKAGAVAILIGLVFAVVGSGLNTAVLQSDSPTASLVSAPTATPSKTPKATTKPTPTPTPTPVATQAEVQEASVIPYAAVSINDDTIDVGATAIAVGGANGEKVTTYLVQYVDGVEVSRAVAREETIVVPVDEVTAIGTRTPAPVVEPEPVAPSAFYENCDAVRAAGADPIYAGDPGYSNKLDRDGDGVACEN